VYLGTSFGLMGGSEDVGVSSGFIYTFEPGKLFEE
jgi:hypothetical protein